MRPSLLSLEKIELPHWPFDLAATLNSGQVFHWENWEGGFVGAVDGTALYLAQPDEHTILSNKPDVAARYLALDHRILEISKTFPVMDNVLNRAFSFCSGIRIIRQPKWECLATFITSSLKQVPHIRAISLKLRQRFGEKAEIPGLPIQFVFPTAAKLALAGESALRECGLGYRAAFLHQAAVAVHEGKLNLDEISLLPDEEALARLCTLKGVGEKIASCALLFGWERLGMFPIDVWIERTLRRLYFPTRRKLTSGKVRDFAWKHFGPYRGYAQQYLFHWARLTRCGETANE